MNGYVLFIIFILVLNSFANDMTNSIDDQEMGENVSYRKIHGVKLRGEDNQWFIETTREYYSSTGELTFDSFSEFQKKVLALFKNVDEIKELAIDVQNTEEVLKLTTEPTSFLKVRELTINTIHTADVLGQIDPSSLKSLNFQSDENNSDIYGMPQVLQSEEVGIFEGCIQDDQLIALTARRIWISSPKNLTPSGINNYIQMSIGNPSFESFQFMWSDEDRFNEFIEELPFGDHPTDKSFIINPLFPEFQTRIVPSGKLLIGGRTKAAVRIEDGDSTDMTSVDEMKIQFTGLGYNLIISLNNSVYWKRFANSSDLQAKLSEKLEEIKVVKELHVNFENTSSEWNLLSGNGEQIEVHHLIVQNNNTSNPDLGMNLLQQMNPQCLKCLELIGKYNKAIFELKQVLQAEYLKISHPNIEDDQLMNFEATTLILGESIDDGPVESTITVAGVNKYIKKCLLGLDKKAHEFQIYLGPTDDYAPLLKGLDIESSRIEPDKHIAEYILNSEHSDYQLQLIINGRKVTGRRIDT